MLRYRRSLILRRVTLYFLGLFPTLELQLSVGRYSNSKLTEKISLKLYRKFSILLRNFYKSHSKCFSSFTRSSSLIIAQPFPNFSNLNLFQTFFNSTKRRTGKTGRYFSGTEKANRSGKGGWGGGFIRTNFGDSNFGESAAIYCFARQLFAF